VPLPLEFENIEPRPGILKIALLDILNDFLERLCDGTFVQQSFSLTYPTALAPAAQRHPGARRSWQSRTALSHIIGHYFSAASRGLPGGAGAPESDLAHINSLGVSRQLDRESGDFRIFRHPRGIVAARTKSASRRQFSMDILFMLSILIVDCLKTVDYNLRASSFLRAACRRPA
jgi:hypothetical protein